MSDDPPVPPTDANMEAVFSHYRHLGMFGLLRPMGILGRPLGLAAAGVSQTFARGTMTVTGGTTPDESSAVPSGEAPPHHFPELLLASEIVTLGDKVDKGHLIERVGVSFRAIFKELSRDRNFLLNFDPRQLEEIIAAAYDKEGCDVILTPRSGDGGRDVIATYKGLGSIRVLDQVKRYDPKNKVPADDVRALFGVLSRDPAASKGVVTTTSVFAPGVATEFATAIPTRLQLREGSDIMRWIEALAKKES